MMTIELNDDQVALVFDDDLSYEVYLPTGDENDNVPNSSLFVLAICVLIKKENETFFELIDSQVNEFLSIELEKE